MAFLRRSFALLFLLMFTQPLRATILIIVYTPDGFWLGADSARHKGESRSATVCKIHETKWGILLKGGNSQGTTYKGAHYSTDKEVEDSLENSMSADDFENNLRLQFKRDIDAELAFLVQDPRTTPENLEVLSFDSPVPATVINELIRTVLLVNPEEQTPGKVLLVAAQSYVTSVDRTNRRPWR